MRRLGTIVATVVAFGLLPGAAAAQQSASSPVVSVRTAPATSGIVLTFAGHSYVTDSAGRVLIPRAPGVVSAEMLPRIRVGSRGDGRAHEGAIRALVHGRQRVRGRTRRLPPGQLALRRHEPGLLSQRRVERLVLRSTSGEVKDIQRDLGRPRWLFARRVSLVRKHLVIKNIDYALQRVTVLGSDVVNAGQQTFAPAQKTEVSFTLAFFTLTVRGEDALFGSAVGTRARLILPNGSVRQLKLDHGQVVVPALPRGTYSVKLADGLYRLSQPLVLSRSQVTVVPVVTYLDVLAVGGGLLLLAVGLVFAGRPYLARRAGARIAYGTRAERGGAAVRRAAPAGIALVAACVGLGRRRAPRRPSTPLRARRPCSPTTTSGSRRPRGAARSATFRCSAATPATTRGSCGSTCAGPRPPGSTASSSAGSRRRRSTIASRA